MSGWASSPARTVVAVLAQQQGTGVLIGHHTVLTSAHILGTARTARIALPHRAEPLLLRVIWADERLDAAVLHGEATGLLLPFQTRLSTVATDRPLPGCEVIGFPRIQRYDEGRRLDLDQYTGTVLPMAGLLRRTMVMELDRPPAAEREDGLSPLAGLSGAPVFAGDGLIGIVRSVPAGRGHRRLECVPLRAIMADDDFRLWHAKAIAPLPAVADLHRVTGNHPVDARYEEEYAEALGAAYRRTKIFGLDELGKRASEWDLDTAYLSLEAASKDPGDSQHVPHRIDELLAARPRVLLRGDAGAGKTTLVWWLAAHAAAGTLGARLAELNGLVPFVVPLRSLRARGSGFPSPAELPAAAGLVIDSAPEGWAGRVLSAGRALLLVDGLDEVPYEEREAAHAWLSALLARYPRTRCVATVRPLAVEPDWLASENFEELTLLPMRDQDIQAFVSAWHAAARLDGDDAGLDALERDLLQQFDHNPPLSDLARTPLLCAVICALHRLRDGFLPETRWALYESALQLLLGDRDKRRRIDAPDGIRMSVEEHQQLLQRLAAWLVRGGQTEFTREQALHQLNRALPGMPRVQAQGTPEEILTHLLNRSGLLQERTDDVFQFAHRTFQDFLAAKEFVEDDLLAELLRHAQEQQWHDVLLLAAGHCSRRELPVLVEGLLAAGSATRKRDLKTTLYVLAALCAQHAAWLSEVLHGRVRKAVSSVIPPMSRPQVHQLARLGAYVLPLLPELGGLSRDSSNRVTDLICSIGGQEALPYAEAAARAGWAGNISPYWERFPTEAFAHRVLPHLAPEATLVVEGREELRHVGHLPQTRVFVIGDLSPAELVEGLGRRPLDRLALATNKLLTDLDVLSALNVGSLRRLTVQSCVHLTNLGALAGLDALEHMSLVLMPTGLPILEAVTRIPRLRELTLDMPRLEDDRLDLSPLHGVPGLTVRVVNVAQRKILGRAAFGDRLVLDTSSS
ncbi:NACHT domain-containing protein [Streptomyces vilmorinianum]|uniref:NACHT domain-containing protein n=1 Tax=Streptomyces vilmorinianum TaxID=3051092 RepID=UPI0010FB3ECB|nr:NACHT domain-containing protein [Streptomyces vilmorinianum]